MLTRSRMGYTLPMLTLALSLALCAPAGAQTVEANNGGGCSQRFSDNILTYWASTRLATGTAPGKTIAATIRSLDIGVTACTVGSVGDGGCHQSQTLDGDKYVEGRGITTGLMEGPYRFQRRHYSSLFVESPFYMETFQISCPPPPDPTAGCKFNCSPIIVPIRNGNYIKLSSAENGVPFDIDGDGDLEFVAWPEEPNDVAFLALDRDGDGEITSGKELFGQATPGALTGFQALAQLDRDLNDNWLVAGRDPGFDSLLLWFDRNRDGISQASELESASDYLVGLSLYAIGAGKRDEHGNRYRMQGLMKLLSKPEERRPVYDIYLLIRQ
jgi:hypothetical protein